MPKLTSFQIAHMTAATAIMDRAVAEREAALAAETVPIGVDLGEPGGDRTAWHCVAPRPSNAPPTPEPAVNVTKRNQSKKRGN